MRLSVAAATALLLLCAAAWIPRISATNGPSSDCCLKISKTRLRLGNIVDYTVQKEGQCPVNAIVFRTCKGKTVCANPEKDWVKKGMEEVEERKKAKRTGETDATVSRKESSCKKKKRRQDRRKEGTGRNGRRRGRSPAPKT